MTKVPCRICHNQIEPKASFCTHCKKYQNKYIQWAANVATFSAAITLLTAVVTYVASSGPGIWSRFFGETLEVVAFSHRDDLSLNATLQNTGNKELYVESFSIYLPNRKKSFSSRSKSVRATVEAGDILSVTVDAEKTGPKANYPYVEGVDGKLEISPDYLAELRRETDCYFVTYSAAGNLSFSSVVEFIEDEPGDSMIWVPHEVWVKYFSGDQQAWREKQVSSAAVLVKNRAARCQAYSLDRIDAPVVVEPE